jgi:putative transcriptional regulator
MRLPRFAVAIAALLAAALPVAANTGAHDPLSAPSVLAAKPEVRGFYKGAVLFVRPLGGGAHVGFIVNRPTDVKLGSLFPGHTPSQKVSLPVLLGGPAFTEALFAVVHRAASPGGKSIPFGHDVFLAFDLEVVDRIIEHEGNEARYVVGLVLWRPGELEDELRQGMWLARAPEARLLFVNPAEAVWEDLVARSRNLI